MDSTLLHFEGTTRISQFEYKPCVKGQITWDHNVIAKFDTQHPSLRKKTDFITHSERFFCVPLKCSGRHDPIAQYPEG